MGMTMSGMRMSWTMVVARSAASLSVAVGLLAATAIAASAQDIPQALRPPPVRRATLHTTHDAV